MIKSQERLKKINSINFNLDKITVDQIGQLGFAPVLKLPGKVYKCLFHHYTCHCNPQKRTPVPIFNYQFNSKGSCRIISQGKQLTPSNIEFINSTKKPFFNDTILYKEFNIDGMYYLLQFNLRTIYNNDLELFEIDSTKIVSVFSFDGFSWRRYTQQKAKLISYTEHTQEIESGKNKNYNYSYQFGKVLKYPKQHNGLFTNEMRLGRKSFSSRLQTAWRKKLGPDNWYKDRIIQRVPNLTLENKNFRYFNGYQINMSEVMEYNWQNPVVETALKQGYITLLNPSIWNPSSLNEALLVENLPKEDIKRLLSSKLWKNDNWDAGGFSSFYRLDTPMDRKFDQDWEQQYNEYWRRDEANYNERKEEVLSLIKDAKIKEIISFTNRTQDQLNEFGREMSNCLSLHFEVKSKIYQVILSSGINLAISYDSSKNSFLEIKLWNNIELPTSFKKRIKKQFRSMVKDGLVTY